MCFYYGSTGWTLIVAFNKGSNQIQFYKKNLQKKNVCGEPYHKSFRHLLGKAHFGQRV